MYGAVLCRPSDAFWNRKSEVLESSRWWKAAGSSKEFERGTICVEEWGTISIGKVHWTILDD